MATYKDIQAFIKTENEYAAKTCWIAHVKELRGLKPRISARRISPDKRVHPCPENKQADISAAFKYFGMV
ncbi:RNA methyltransferase fusion protein [Planococcus antarcticus DSM 14505]|uniref:RNA methyltransferase fusion protein n=1 Tax=Planococcus antarcticus DSM 14505 TaxID=1185653 RepID=A0A1C7DKP2_9BACL|nr:hypothetical protein [Planococcus antarcticus]ANU11952.1 hypothetical protein BBH88_17680 [Planococcus antarcticus DSM 14505]EIM05958.1 RNA methyltransferase fusion protein [Planococcus antarcticus DSM 14505]